MAIALLVFSQTFGGAIFITIAQNIFTSSLSSQLAERLSVTEAVKVLEAGARDIPGIVSGDNLRIVLQAYSDSIDKVFYLPLAAGIALFITAWGMGWHDITQKTLIPSPSPTRKDEEH